MATGSNIRKPSILFNGAMRTSAFSLGEFRIFCEVSELTGVTLDAPNLMPAGSMVYDEDLDDVDPSIVVRGK